MISLKNIIIKSIFASFAFLITPALAFARIPGILGETGGIVPCINDCHLDSVYALINNIVVWGAYISFAIGVIAFVFAGYTYITAQGNAGKLEKAHTWFVNIFIGLFFIIGSVLIVSTIMRALLKQDVYNRTEVGGRLGGINTSKPL